jgi:hypothetical protein
MFRFSSIEDGIDFLESNSYRFRLFTSNVYHVIPPIITIGYPKYDGSDDPLHIAVLLGDGRLSLCNEDNKMIQDYHFSLEKLLTQKKIL